MSIALLVLMIAAFIAVELYRLRSGRAEHVQRAPAAVLPEPLQLPYLPYGHFVLPSHSWMRFAEGDSLAVGVDSLVSGAAGEIRSIELVAAGSTVVSGEPLATLELPNGRLVIAAPTSGEVVAVNGALRRRPGLLLADPYGLGWLAKVRPRDHKAALDRAFVGNGAVAFLRREYRRLVESVAGFGTAAALPALPDGALLERGVLRRLAPAELAQFQREFLDPQV